MSTREVNGFVIESGIPIPPKAKGKARTGFTGAIEALKVGDSLLISDASKRANACTVAERLGYKVVTRAVDEGVRMWRTE